MAPLAQAHAKDYREVMTNELTVIVAVCVVLGLVIAYAIHFFPKDED